MAFPLKTPMWCPGIRQGHPLSIGLEAHWPFWVGSGNRITDLMPSRRWSLSKIAGNTSVWVPQGMRFDGVNGSQRLRSPVTDLILNDYTIAVLLRPGSTNQLRALHWTSAWLSDGFYIEQTATPTWLHYHFSNGVAKACVSAAAPSGDFQLIVGMRQGAEISLWVDAVKEGDTEFEATAISPNDEIYFASDVNGWWQWDHDIRGGWLYSRALTAGAIEWLYREPWDLTTPRQRSYFWAAASGAAAPMLRGKIGSTLAEGRGRLVA